MTSIYYTATSLDGFIADQANHLEWLFQFGELEPNTFNTFLQSIGAIPMVSTTYQWIYDHDFSSRAENSQPYPYKMSTWVFSSRKFPIIADADTRFVSGDVRPIHQEMAFAAGDKNIWIVGGGDLAGQFYECGLLNEIVVRIASVTTFGQDFVELYYQVPAR